PIWRSYKVVHHRGKSLGLSDARVTVDAYMSDSSSSFGSWHLDALIAVGGLGEIWRARRGNEAAALKRLHTHLIRNDEAVHQFSLEQRLATRLPHHPNVVHATEADTVAGRPYVALELVPGEDLRRIVAPPASTSDPSPPRAVLPRARAVAILTAA